jgi:hypothetical protein
VAAESAHDRIVVRRAVVVLRCKWRGKQLPYQILPHKKGVDSGNSAAYQRVSLFTP